MFAGELTDGQRIALLETRVNELERITAGMSQGNKGAQPEAVLLLASSPVDSQSCGAWGGNWLDVTGYAEKYGKFEHYHTGSDLNLKDYADSGANVYASADGRIVYSGKVAGWQGDVVVIEHVDAGQLVWTRYAHIASIVTAGSTARGGMVIGTIADYEPIHDPRGDHLHFDVSHVDLGAKPGDWPGLDRARVLRDYIDPLKWLQDHAK